MAMPKSKIYLAVATLGMLLFLLVQFKNPRGSEVEMQFPDKLPTTKLGDWDHDPQSDRMWTRL